MQPLKIRNGNSSELEYLWGLRQISNRVIAKVKGGFLYKVFLFYFFFQTNTSRGRKGVL